MCLAHESTQREPRAGLALLDQYQDYVLEAPSSTVPCSVPKHRQLPLCRDLPHLRRRRSWQGRRRGTWAPLGFLLRRASRVPGCRCRRCSRPPSALKRQRGNGHGRRCPPSGRNYLPQPLPQPYLGKMQWRDPAKAPPTLRASGRWRPRDAPSPYLPRPQAGHESSPQSVSSHHLQGHAPPAADEQHCAHPASFSLPPRSHHSEHPSTASWLTLPWDSARRPRGCQQHGRPLLPGVR
mmetsp:Transcript_21673/g.60137  ORF Transcript_21673/g.60137 Transcript_21673/m.60137 type:complete len:237 (+) Transcript_21673:385-1095(+)